MSDLPIADKPKPPSLLKRLLSKLSRKPQTRDVKVLFHPAPSELQVTDTCEQESLPRRKFHIASRVINLNEVSTNGTPTGELRYIREAQYSESQKQWLYQLNGKNFTNKAGWVAEDLLRRYPSK